MPSEVTDEAREAALRVLDATLWGGEPDGREGRVSAAVIDALLAAGWTPPAQPDAIAAAYARGRREGVEAAAKVADEHAIQAQARMSGYGDLDDALHGEVDAAEAIAEAVRALSSIPQEADQ